MYHPQKKVVVIGLGYVGLPLAIALARKFDVIGFDINEARIAELKEGFDRTNEVESEQLRSSTIKLTTHSEECADRDFYIVTVPTPVDADNEPDLGALRSASRTVGRMLKTHGSPVVVYESTVYPGVTEDICGPLLEEVSGLVCGRDFFLGYSPERINPGDKEHTIERIVKIVAGQDEETTQKLEDLYGAVTSAGTFRAVSIRVAEAAKVIENAQRDINIAFVNEIAAVFHKMGISVWDVLDAARTKWNFLPFQPGLVGGHCIGVDPYYLSHKARSLGVDPQVILAGRSINDGMSGWIAQSLSGQCSGAEEILVMGLSFKENVPDLRNSKVVDVIRALEAAGHKVTAHDPLVDPEEAKEEYGIDLPEDALRRSYGLVFVAVPHQIYSDLSDTDLSNLVREGGVLADLKGLYRQRELPGISRRWQL